MTELIAILRAIQPNEILAIAETLIHSGFNTLEVPLNSPDAFQSIELLAREFAAEALIGAGTVTQVAQVAQLVNAGGQLLVAPNCNPSVIHAGKTAGLMTLPGVFTATECFAALEAGADGLKLFPASKLGLDGFQSLKAVLPVQTPCYAVGGVGAADFAQWLNAGIHGFGLGSALYQAGDSVASVNQKAKRLMSAWQQALMVNQ